MKSPQTLLQEAEQNIVANTLFYHNVIELFDRLVDKVLNNAPSEARRDIYQGVDQLRKGLLLAQHAANTKLIVFSNIGGKPVEDAVNKLCVEWFHKANIEDLRGCLQDVYGCVDRNTEEEAVQLGEEIFEQLEQKGKE